MCIYLHFRHVPELIPKPADRDERGFISISDGPGAAVKMKHLVQPEKTAENEEKSNRNCSQRYDDGKHERQAETGPIRANEKIVRSEKRNEPEQE